MSSNVVNQAPFLRTSRNFPQEIQALAVEINKSYVDIANSVNQRTIGIFPANTQAITGEQWFVASGNQRQQTLRKVFTFTAAGNIPHGISFTNLSGFTRIYGTFTDGSIWYPLPYVDVTSATNQVNVIVNSTNIVISSGSGTPPTISSGFLVLEWLSIGS